MFRINSESREAVPQEARDWSAPEAANENPAEAKTLADRRDVIRIPAVVLVARFAKETAQMFGAQNKAQMESGGRDIILPGFIERIAALGDVEKLVAAAGDPEVKDEIEHVISMLEKRAREEEPERSLLQELLRLQQEWEVEDGE